MNCIMFFNLENKKETFYLNDSMQVFNMQIQCRYSICIASCFAIKSTKRKHSLIHMIQFRSSIWRFNVNIQYVLHHVLQFKVPKGNIFLHDSIQVFNMEIQCRYSICIASCFAFRVSLILIDLNYCIIPCNICKNIQEY